MYNKYNITKEMLEPLVKAGKSQREIAEIIGCSKSNIGHFIQKFGLSDLAAHRKLPSYKINAINTKEKAYVLGAICCDGAIDDNNQVEMSVAKADKEFIDFIAKEVNGKVCIDDTYCPEQRRFPRARLSKRIPDIKTFLGGPKKPDRHFPITKDKFVRYALLGAFDADGSLSWGRRKDSNRIWQKISFTTSLKIATGIQNVLYKYLNISTTVRPKTGENCYVIEFANRSDVLKFLDYIYQDDFVVLTRKYSKYKALRLELEENGEGTKQ